MISLLLRDSMAKPRMTALLTMLEMTTHLMTADI